MPDQSRPAEIAAESGGSAVAPVAPRSNALLARYDELVRLLVRVAEFATVVISFFITGSMIASVFARYILNSSVGWMEEISSLLLAVLMFLIIGVGFHERIQIGVDLLIDQLPPRGQRVLDIAIHAISGLFFMIIGVTGLAMAQMGMDMTLATVELPRGLFHYAIPIGSFFTVMVCINNILKVATGGSHARFGGIG
jgi:TRAP-type transport system small permease protein